MRFTAQAGELAGLLGHVKRSVPARSTIPLLSHVEMIAHGDKLRIRGTNLDVEMWGFVDAPTIEAGAVAVPGLAAQSIISRLKKDAPVEIAVTDGERVVISSGRSRYELSTIELEGFPAEREPHEAERAEIRIAPTNLAWLASVTRAFVGPPDSGRRFAEGVHFYCDGRRLFAVATDTNHLVEAFVEIEDGSGFPDDVIIRPEIVAEFEALAKTSEPEVSLFVDRFRVMLRTSIGTATAALIDARFPPYQKLLPERGEPFAVASASEIVEAADRAMLAYTGLDVKASILVISTLDNTLAIETEKNKQNDGHEEVEADLSEQDVTLKCDGKRLRNLLALWGDARVSFQWSGRTDEPLLIYSDDNPNMRQILMLIHK